LGIAADLLTQRYPTSAGAASRPVRAGRSVRDRAADRTLHMTNLSDEEQEALVNEPVAGPLPHERLDARDPAAAANADEVCAICFDAFHVGETVAQLPCGHRYHANCVGAWLKNATTCPGCRAEVSDEAVKTAAGASNLPGLNAPDTGAAAPPAGVSQARLQWSPRHRQIRSPPQQRGQRNTGCSYAWSYTRRGAVGSKHRSLLLTTPEHT
jgi:hypothetical protein